MQPIYGDMESYMCEKCPDRKTCSKVCDMVANIMRKEGIYHAQYIRPTLSNTLRTGKDDKYREIPFSSLRKASKRKIGIEDGTSSFEHNNS